MGATNLKQWYESKGEALPTVTDRSKEFERVGLGSASMYIGSAEQNIELLKELKKGV